MTRRILSVAALVFVLITTVLARPGHATWVSSNCFDNALLDNGLKRADARAYAAYADHEGYEWGGGCWNNDNRDDTPNAPDSGGEGPDCSGLVFKTWELPMTYGAQGFRHYNRLMNVHGPYVAQDFHSAGPNLPFHDLANKYRRSTLYMDGFASSVHVGLIWSDAVPSAGGDYIIEALGDLYGTNVNVENYRSDSRFLAVRREGWTADCSPRCPAAPPPSRLVTVG
jgi:hypothetical protein